MTQPRILLHVEGAVLLAASVYAFHALHGGWGWFALLFLAPDIFMVGYLLNKQLGTLLYNVAHTTLAPALLAALLLLMHHPGGLWICAVWLAHIGWDRMIGYGLKYPTDFKDTHLQRV